MRDFRIDTRRGPVIFTAPDDFHASARPAVVMFHGAFRAARDFLEISRTFTSAAPVFARLPDHEGPPLDEMSVEAYIDAFRQALPNLLGARHAVALGESLGGLIALGMPVSRIVALDPPLTLSKQWALRDLIQSSPERGSKRAFQYFGIGDSPEERDYWPIVDRLQVPATIIVGEDRLGKRRSVDLTPSLLDGADLERLAQHPLIEVRVAKGAGHIIMGVNDLTIHQALEEALKAVAT